MFSADDERGKNYRGDARVKKKKTDKERTWKAK